jgi:N utilization substance protein B
LAPSRRKSREFVLQVLFSSDAQQKDPTLVFEELKNHFQATENGPVKIQKVDLDFADPIVARLSGERGSIDRLIQKISKNWKLYRMNPVDRNILRMAIAEARQFPETPLKVITNEAIEIAKIYGTENSASFVNGVLDKIHSMVPDIYSAKDVSQLMKNFKDFD